MPHNNKPEAAYVEDCNSEVGDPIEGTRRQAKRRSTTSGPPRSMDRFRTSQRDGAHDSGYSSMVGASRGKEPAQSRAVADAEAMPPPPRPTISQSQSRGKPVVNQTSRPQPPSRSHSTARSSVACDDPNCIAADCPTAIEAARRRSGSYMYNVSQQTTSPMQYQQYAQYQYAQVPQVGAQTVPQLNAQPSVSARTRQTRPNSVYGVASFDGAQAGQYSTAATMEQQQAWARYYAYHQQAREQQLRQQQQLQQQAYQASYGTSPATQTLPVYPVQSPAHPSPTSPDYSTPSTPMGRTFSARATNTGMASSHDTSTARPGAPLSRTMSARQPSARTHAMPGGWVSEHESSETESDSEYSDEELSEEESRRHHRPQQRDSRHMSSSSQRRPSMSKHYVSAPAVPTQSSRHSYRPTRRSDPIQEYSPSDNVDSDRTARADIGRTYTHYSNSSRGSRRPSQDTASSSRTKSTNISSLNSAMGMIEITNSNGRRYQYLSQRDKDELATRSNRRNSVYLDPEEEEYIRRKQEATRRRRDSEERHRQREMDAEDYQEDIRGGPLTAANLKAAQSPLKRQESVSGRSRQTSHSGVSKARGADGLTIETGGTVFHVHGEATIEMPAGEDGGLAKIKVGSSGEQRRDRDSAYYGSRSSSSRVGRSQGGSEVGRGRRASVSVGKDTGRAA